MAYSKEAKVKTNYSIRSNVIEGTVLNMKLDLGFLRLMGFPRMMLRMLDLNKAEQDPLTMRTQMK